MGIAPSKPVHGEKENETDNRGLIPVIAISAAIVVVFLVGLVLCYDGRRRSRTQDIANQEIAN